MIKMIYKAIYSPIKDSKKFDRYNLYKNNNLLFLGVTSEFCMVYFFNNAKHEDCYLEQYKDKRTVLLRKSDIEKLLNDICKVCGFCNSSIIEGCKPP